MRRIAAILTALALLAIGLSGCGMSAKANATHACQQTDRSVDGDSAQVAHKLCLCLIPKYQANGGSLTDLTTIFQDLRNPIKIQRLAQNASASDKRDLRALLSSQQPCLRHIALNTN